MITHEIVELLRNGILPESQFQELKDQLNSYTPIRQSTIRPVGKAKRQFRALSFTSCYKIPSGLSADEHVTYYITISIRLDDNDVFVPFEIIIRSDIVSNVDLYKLIGKTLSFFMRHSDLEGIQDYIKAIDNIKSHHLVAGIWNNGKNMNSRGEIIKDALEHVYDWCKCVNQLDLQTRIIISNLIEQPSPIHTSNKVEKIAVQQIEIKKGNCPMCHTGKLIKRAGCTECDSCEYKGNCD